MENFHSGEGCSHVPNRKIVEIPLEKAKTASACRAGAKRSKRKSTPETRRQPPKKSLPHPRLPRHSQTIFPFLLRILPQFGRII
jgi:hypothetical protein